jgi:hypothetical protein
LPILKAQMPYLYYRIPEGPKKSAVAAPRNGPLKGREEREGKGDKRKAESGKGGCVYIININMYSAK